MVSPTASDTHHESRYSYIDGKNRKKNYKIKMLPTLVCSEQIVCSQVFSAMMN